MKLRSRFALVALWAGLLSPPAAAQSRSANGSEDLYLPAAGSHVSLVGTSNVHDWTARSDVIDGYARIPATQKADVPLARLEWLRSKKVNPTLVAKIPVRSLKSKHKGMDGKMYEALRARGYPYILFELEEITGAEAGEAGAVTARATGKLSVAGVVRPIVLHVLIRRPDATRFQIEGAISLDMTAFGISPPTALLGTLHTGKWVRIGFFWALGRRSP